MADHPDERTFPGEDEWLTLPCPPVAIDFVERTLLRVHEDQRQQDAELGRLLATYQVPEPSASFVRRTLAARSRRPDENLPVRLPGAATPTPSPHFVDRVLAALREERTETWPREELATTPRHPSARVMLWASVAAALLVALAIVRLRGPGLRWPSQPLEVVTADTFATDRWGAALAALQNDGLEIRAEDPALALAHAASRRGGD